MSIQIEKIKLGSETIIHYESYDLDTSTTKTDCVDNKLQEKIDILIGASTQFIRKYPENPDPSGQG